MVAPRYRDECLLGVGGMAEVWRASGPVGPVALKRLLPHAARNPSVAAAFEREGRLLQRIHHPNVIGIHEVVRDETGTSLVLEYVEGHDLHALTDQPIEPKIAMRICADVLRALEAVHGLNDEAGRPLGLIHRDLTPANVLIGVDGAVKLTDFGIARAARGTHATTGQHVKGTLAYLSPEQATGAPIDARSDLFAAGALLYQMLTGSPIYDDEDPRLALARARAADVHSLSMVRPGTPPDIIELVDRALAARPSDRFPTAGMMLAEVVRVAEQTCGLATDAEMAAWARNLSAAAPPRMDGPTPIATSGTVEFRRQSKVRTRAIVAGVLIGGLASWWGVSSWQGQKRTQTMARAVASIQATAAPAPSTAPSVPAEIATAPPPSGSSGTERASAEPRLPEHRKRASETHPLAGEARPTNEARAAETPTPSPAGEKCLLDIGSEPAFAYVSIDGVRAGATPLFGREVTPGVHRIEVSRDGLGSKTFTIEARPGDRISRVIKLP